MTVNIFGTSILVALMWQLKKCYAVLLLLLLLLLLVKVTFYRFSQDDKPQHVTPEFLSAPHILTGFCAVSAVTPLSQPSRTICEKYFLFLTELNS